MNKLIISALIFTTIGLASADENVLNVSNITHEGGKTKVSLSRDISKYNVYTDSYQSYQLGAFTKSFNGNLTDKEIVEKVSRIVDNFITVKSGAYKVEGKNQTLALARSKAFFDGGYFGYFAELERQLADEK